MPTDNYVLLEKVVVGAATASSVVFNSIPQTYTDLVVKVSARSTSSTGAPWIYVSLNGSGSGFTFQNVNSDGATTYAGTTVFAVNQSNSQTANTFGSAEFYLSNYTSSKYKTISVDSMQENNSTTASMFAGSAMWANTSAITSITFQTDGNYAQHSSFSLYGISKSGVLPSTAPKAIGGNTIMNDGSYWYHAFTTSGTFTPIDLMTADILVVAGGGSGGGTTCCGVWPGGGGAGGVIAHSLQSLTATDYSVTIGAGGASPTAGGHPNGNQGNNSQFGSLTAAVGGGYGSGLQQSGGAGGSGGGAGDYTDNQLGGAATSGQGFAGGNGGGGGGGGAGAAGTAGTRTANGVAGGAGTNTYSAWLSSTGLGVNGYIAGGGGGSASSGGTAGPGGAGGGGASGTYQSNGSAAIANTGSGGGAGGQSQGPNTIGGAGGSGLVIVRYAV